MTSRTLVLLRHAKAERPDGPADIERPLTGRGRADAAAAGAWLARHDRVPDLVICSPSRRTRQTWHGVAEALAVAPRVAYDRRLYDGDAADLLAAVRGAENDAGTVLLIGHNPTISLLSHQLDPKAADDSDGLRTAGIAVHEVTAAWADLDTAPRIDRYTARG